MLEFLKFAVGHGALAPLLLYAQCQHWLAAHHPDGSDLEEAGGVAAFAPALQHHIVSRCLASTAGTVFSPNVQLGFK